jgi:hypothetical protein
MAPRDHPSTARAALRFGNELADLAIAITSPIRNRGCKNSAGAWPGGFWDELRSSGSIHCLCKNNCGMAVFCFPLLRSELSDECSEMRRHWSRDRVVLVATGSV